MIRYALCFIVFISGVVNAQKIDYNHFDKKLFNKILFQKLNDYRQQNNIELLLWSEVIFNQITSVNVNSMVSKDSLFHPEMKPMWDSLRVRKLIANESYKLVKIKTSISICTGPSMTLYENAFFTGRIEGTYQDLAERAIKGWEQSPIHKATQYASFEKSGKPGLAACAVGLANKGIYITFNFVEVYR